MAGTAYSSLITSVRRQLNETTASFWSDAELLDYATKGTADLWEALVDLHQEHFLTDDITNVSLAASSSSLTGVPADLFRVYQIEPRDTTVSGTSRAVLFIPREYNHADFATARGYSAQDPSQATRIYYAVTGAGAPTGAPTIRVAPQVSSAINLRLTYIPTLGVSAYTTSSTNPIPGESDNAIIAWTIAYAKAKESEFGMPDPGWLAIYATEKEGLKISLTPRQEQEIETVDDLFGVFWGA